MSASEPLSPSYEELAALVAGLTSQLEQAHARIAELEARLGRDSRNSSILPSADSIEAKATRRADRSSRERSKDRKPGGQPGRQGSGLAPTVTPDRTETLPAPSDCSGCGEDLAEAVDAGIRHATGVLKLHPTHQHWAGEVITVLREAAAAVGWGITTNRHRTWTKGHHPGYNLATRLRDKADQVFTFTRNLTVPRTNNASEQALTSPKRHQAVSGY